jgi:hypothetical protein
MAAGGMATDDDAPGMRAVSRPLASDPGERAAAFVDDGRDRHFGTEVVVDDGDREPLRDERGGDEGKVALVERAPIAAVYEDERPACAGRRNEEIERFLRPRAVAQIEPRQKVRARLGRGLRVPREPPRMIGDRARLL